MWPDGNWQRLDHDGEVASESSPEAHFGWVPTTAVRYLRPAAEGPKQILGRKRQQQRQTALHLPVFKQTSNRAKMAF